MHFQATNTGFSFYLFLKEKRHFWWKRGTCDGVQSFRNKKETQLCQPRDNFVGKEIFLRKRNTCVGVKTLFEGKETPVSEKKHFWWKRVTCLWRSIETLLEWKRDTCVLMNFQATRIKSLKKTNLFFNVWSC